MRLTRLSTRGFILIPVAVAIAIIGVLAFYSANQSAMNVNSTNREVEATRAELVAQAGLQHGLRQAAHQGCGPYSDLTSVNFGADQYGTSLTNDLGPTNFYTVPTDQDNWIRSDRLMNNYGSDNTLQVRFENGNIERPMFRYDLSAIPANSPVISARAFFYVSSSFPEGSVDIHRISADWAEDTATYGNMGDEIDALVINSIPAQPSANIWVEVNLTSQVQAWVNGQPNFGITLNSTIEGTRGDFASQESSNASYIEVVTGTAPSPNAVLKSVGTLANGLKRTILRTDVTLQQNPLSLVHLQPDASAGQDAEIWDQSPNNNYGNADETWVSSANNDKTRTLLRFNMGQVPYGAKILGATLSLERRSGQGANLPVAAHRITNPWIEDEVTWNRRENGVNWNSSGADFENSAVSTTLIGSANIRYEWEIDSLVQGWVDGTFPNYGVILVPAVAGMTGERFHTSDHTDSTHWPSLSITYTCECGTVCMGPQTKASSGRIIMIGNWGGPTPNPVDLGKETLIESWGYEVDHVDDDYIWTVNFNDYDLIYVSETVRAGDVSGQIEWRSIGIVNEEGDLHDNIGFSAAEAYDIGSTVEIVDNSHFITAPFANGYLSIYNGDMELLYGGGALGSGMQALANVGGIASLMVLNTGAIGLNGAAAGKRVALPVGRYGDSGFDWKHLNANGHLLIQRSIEWAMGGGSFSQGDLLLVVNNDNNLTTQEEAKRALFESWNWTVNIIDSGDNQGEFDNAAAANDVVYIGEDINANDLGNKLVDANIGVVLEEANLVDEFGLAPGIDWSTKTEVKLIQDHYITSTLPNTANTFFTTTESMADLVGYASEMAILARNDEGPVLTALEDGRPLYGGGTAAGRRVFLPWGGNDMDINNLNDDGRTVLERSLEWANGAELDFSPLAHWKLDEETGIIAEDSEGGHNGTLANGPAWSAGMVDGGLYFDGVDDTISVGSQDTMDDLFNGGATITGWMYARGWGGGNFGRIVDKADALGSNRNGWAFELYGANRALLFQYGFSGAIGNWYTPVDSISLDRWHHVAVTYDNSSASYNPTIYIDGVAQTLIELDTPSGTPSSDADSELHLGNYANDLSRSFHGVLDDIQIFDRLLDASEIAAMAVPTGPIAHWKLDDGSGNTALDSVGGHDATITNPVWDPSGQDGGALRVASLAQAGAAPHDDTLNLNRGLTLMAWVNKANLSFYDGAITKASTGSDINYLLGTWENEIVFGFSTTTDNWQGYYTNGVNLTLGNWNHIAASFDNTVNEVRIYRNGSLVQSFSTTLEPVTNSGNLWLGRTALTNEILNGRLDDARIYNRVLDASEILAIHDATAGGGGGPGDSCDIDPNGTYIEAEHYVPPLVDGSSNYQLVINNSTSGANGGEYLESVGGTTQSSPTGQRADYPVNFPVGGTYYFWLRANDGSGGGDSTFLGLDGNHVGALTQTGSNWNWTTNVQGGTGSNSVSVTAGTHTLNMWPRENGQQSDGFLISTNPNPLGLSNGSTDGIPTGATMVNPTDCSGG